MSDCMVCLAIVMSSSAKVLILNMPSGKSLANIGAAVSNTPLKTYFFIFSTYVSFSGCNSLLKVEEGILSNALLLGTKIVKVPALLNVSDKPAASISLENVDKLPFEAHSSAIVFVVDVSLLTCFTGVRSFSLW